MGVTRYLADKSALARLHLPAVREELEPLILRALVGICGVTELEMLFSARNIQERSRMKEQLAASLDRVDTPQDIWSQAAEIQEALTEQARHRSASIPDLIIAATARARGLEILHYDRDFDTIARYTEQPARWIVPPGTVLPPPYRVDRPGVGSAGRAVFAGLIEADHARVQADADRGGRPAWPSWRSMRSASAWSIPTRMPSCYSRPKSLYTARDSGRPVRLRSRPRTYRPRPPDPSDWLALTGWLPVQGPWCSVFPDGVSGETTGTCFNSGVEVANLDGGRPARVTIRQVAELAGVSIATVSRVINGHSDVSSETREAVQRVIRERGYQVGARPRAGRTGRIGIMVPLVHPGYFAEILAGAAEALYEQDMRVVLCPTRHSHSRELSLLDRLADGEADGAVVVLPEESGEEFGMLAAHGFPFVIVDPQTEVSEGIPVVCAAHSAGATQATRHLLALGHRRIGVVSGPEGWVATEERLRGYHAALAGSGVLPDPSLVQHSNFRIDGGRDAADCLLAQPDPPTAIFAFNDSMAIGAMQAASARGLRVPEDISVVGFDDTIEAAVTVPALTTIRQPLAELGRTAVSLLLRQIQNKRLEPLRVELATKLVVRDSTTRIADKTSPRPPGH